MKFLITLILIFVSFIVYIRWMELKVVFSPSKNLKNTPAEFGMEYEDVYFQTKDKFKINGWFVKGASDGIVLFFHGNRGNMSNTIQKIKMFNMIGFDVFVIDYRGYGKSEGAPTELGLYRDAQAAYNYLQSRPDINMTNLVIYGESLGGAVAIDLASKNESYGVIVDSAFTNVLDMAKELYPYIPPFLIGLEFDSLSKIASIKCPKIFIHSFKDELVLFQLGQKLYDAAVQPKEFYYHDKTGHNSNNESGVEVARLVFERFIKKYILYDKLRWGI